MLSKLLSFASLIPFLATNSQAGSHIERECEETRPEWVPNDEPAMRACFEYSTSDTSSSDDDENDIPVAFKILLDIDTYVYDTNSNFPLELSDGKWDLLDAITNEVVYECCGHETILNIPNKAKDMTTLKNFVVNYFIDGLLPPMPPQRRYAMHYYFIDEEYRQTIIKSGTNDNICNKNEFFFNVPCDIWDKCQIFPNDNDNIIPPNYINPSAILAGMGNHLVNPGFSQYGAEMTLVIGNYDGILNFIVPSISIQFLNGFLDRYNDAVTSSGTAGSDSSDGSSSSDSSSGNGNNNNNGGFLEKYVECYPLTLNDNQKFSFEGYYPIQICFKIVIDLDACGSSSSSSESNSNCDEELVAVEYSDYQYFESP